MTVSPLAGVTKTPRYAASRGAQAWSQAESPWHAVEIRHECSQDEVKTVEKTQFIQCG